MSRSSALERRALEMTVTPKPPDGATVHGLHDALDLGGLERWRCVEDEASCGAACIDPVENANVKMDI